MENSFIERQTAEFAATQTTIMPEHLLRKEVIGLTTILNNVDARQDIEDKSNACVGLLFNVMITTSMSLRPDGSSNAGLLDRFDTVRESINQFKQDVLAQTPANAPEIGSIVQPFHKFTSETASPAQALVWKTAAGCINVLFTILIKHAQTFHGDVSNSTLLTTHDAVRKAICVYAEAITSTKTLAATEQAIESALGGS